MWLQISFVVVAAFAYSASIPLHTPNAHAAHNIQMTLDPEVVIPGMTPDFYLTCKVPSSLTEKVISLTIQRQTALRLTQHPESIVTLDMKNPTRPWTHTHVNKHIHATGYLPGFNDMGIHAHMHLIWPSPSLDDIGLYFCQANVMHASGSVTSRSSAVIVSTADPSVGNIDVLRQLETQIHQLYKRYFGQNKGPETTPEPTTQPPTERPTTTTATTTTTTTTTTTPPPTTRPTTRLPTIRSTTPTATMETMEPTEAGDYDIVEDFFTFGNHTYFFVNASLPKVAEDAMTMCEDAGMTLAYIPSQAIYEKLRMFFASLLPPQQSMLLSLRGPNGAWSWPYKGDRFFLTLHLNTATEMQQCLAITSIGKSETALTLEPCTTPFQYYVCSLPQNIMA